MSNRREELEASIADLRRMLEDSPPEMRPILLSQIKNMEELLPSLDRLAQAEEENKKYRPSLTPERAAFFQPEPPASLPLWIPDEIQRSEVTEAMLRCPPGARVYSSDDAVSCAVAPRPGGIPIPHGLALFFHPSGRLSAQRFYEHGLLRWDVSYHSTGGRASQGHYCDREPKEHRAHGLQTSFSYGGTILSQAWYHDGKRHGWSKLWEEDGYPIQGARYEFDEKVEEVFPDGTYRALRS